MQAKKSDHTILPLAMPALILLVGCGETPTAAPTRGPSIFTPTPTQIPPSPAASISGRVWHDSCAVSGGEADAPLAPSAGCVPTSDGGYQANGLLEAGEPGLGGVYWSNPTLSGNPTLVRNDVSIDFIRLWWEKVSLVSYPDWRGEYWSNDSLSGAPTLARNDEEIDFGWSASALAAGLPADDFSVRWFRETTFVPGIYLLYAQADGGTRVYLDEQVVLNEWHTSDGEDVYVAEVALSGVRRLVVEYYEQGGDALVKFWWKRAGG